jgi:pimeloyl-ACP methyl ester carboxylesterase
MRQLANMLCAAGYHVLRFDYYGTGDSAGDSHDASLHTWGEDIETAIDELRDTASVTRITLVGLRIGAALAAQVACRDKRIDSLLLWDPVVSGPEYLEELLAAMDTREGQERTEADGGPPLPTVTADGCYPIRGFPLSSALSDEFRAIDLTGQVAALPARTRVICSAPLQSHEALREQLTSQARQDIVIENIDGVLAWRQHRDLGAGAVPTPVLEAIVRWLR